MTECDVGGELLDEDIPIQPLHEIRDQAEDATWLVEGLIPENQITLIGGERAAMKTYIAWGLGTAVASFNDQFIGRTTKRAQVIYIDMENPSSVIKDRSNKIGCPPGVFMWSKNVHQDNPPPTVDKNADLAKYLRLIERFGPNPLMVFDTFSKMHNREQNNNDEMKYIMAQFRQLANAGATVLLLHHMSIAKQGERNMKSMGAQAIEADSDNVYHLKKLQDKGKVTLYCEKNRLEYVPTLKLRLTGNKHFMCWMDISDPADECPF